MELDDATRDELAGFYARRFPTDAARASLARAVGLAADEGDSDARAAWVGLLARADRAGVLARLADAACAAAPDDRNLAEARTLLRGDRAAGGRGGRAVPIAAALVVALVGVGGVGAWWVGSRADAGPARVDAPAAAAPMATERVAAAPMATEPVAAAPVATDPEAAEPEPANAIPVPVPDPVPVTQAPALPAAAPEPLGSPTAGAAVTASIPVSASASAYTPTRGPLGRCQGAPGVVFGWWYAGSTAPGAAGATITLPSSVNVRDDYPREENRYALAGQVLCSLSAGTTQRLSQAPVDIGQGHWWVPVAGGDIGG